MPLQASWRPKKILGIFHAILQAISYVFFSRFQHLQTYVVLRVTPIYLFGFPLVHMAELCIRI